MQNKPSLLVWARETEAIVKLGQTSASGGLAPSNGMFLSGHKLLLNGWQVGQDPIAGVKN